MIFNPFKDWLFRGPFNKGFRTYIMTKNIHWYQKVSMLTYLSSYLVSSYPCQCSDVVLQLPDYVTSARFARQATLLHSLVTC